MNGKSKKKATTKPKPKKKTSKYHQKIKIDASFDELMNAAINPTKK